MSYKLTDGEYTPDGEGGLVKCEYIDEIVQNITLALKTRRHEFYPDGKYGSRLKDTDTEPYGEYAAAYIRQALDGFDGVFVERAERDGDNLTITFLINSTEREVTLPIEEDIQ